jgi:polar amino acid transport system substrate-binding protein
MLQVIQYQKTGELSVEEVPAPALAPGSILVRNVRSLISAGTERTSVETAQASMVGKARSRPDLVKQVIANVRREGLGATYKKVQNRLDNYKELGYSSAGVVLASASDAFAPGDRVACAGTAYHAEIVSVPRHLAAKIPEGVGFDQAAFCTLGAIAMQGVRQADIRLGERVAVIGLGLLGLLTVQLLKAAGCRVAGLDINKNNFALAGRLGCDLCLKSGEASSDAVASFTGGHGTDAVIITASTRSNEPLELALKFARKRSPVVVVGAVGMNVPRSPFYEKELDLRIAMSYGPGRYDPQYEQWGLDYPIGFVRWTENRNMESVLDLMSSGRLDARSLVTHTIPIREALSAYDLITGKRKEPYLGILLEYPTPSGKAEELVRHIPMAGASPSPAPGTPVVGFLGAGNFAQSYLLPPLRKAGVSLKCVVTSRPVSARAAAQKFGFASCGTDAAALFDDSAITALFVATRHDSHARYAARALRSGKHVFVEKPLALNVEELADVRSAAASSPDRCLMVGFNRRFSRPFRDIKTFFAGRQEPMTVLYRVNAGAIPPAHWIQDPAQGGRIIGEGCHFIDIMAFLTGSLPVYVSALEAVSTAVPQSLHDTVSAIIRFADGSLGTLLYEANGDGSLAKEYCEVSSGGKSAILDNFTSVAFHDQGKTQRKRYDGGKGHSEEVAHFAAVIAGKELPALTFESIERTTLATFAIMQSLREKGGVEISSLVS